MLLNVSADEKILPTTYGELRPPLGKHRLKVGLFGIMFVPCMIFILFQYLINVCLLMKLNKFLAEVIAISCYPKRSCIVEVVVVMLV